MDNKHDNNKYKSELYTKMMELEYAIIMWSLMNSQSNPGAVMDLRDMKKRIRKNKERIRI